MSKYRFLLASNADAGFLGYCSNQREPLSNLKSNHDASLRLILSLSWWTCHIFMKLCRKYRHHHHTPYYELCSSVLECIANLPFCIRQQFIFAAHLNFTIFDINNSSFFMSAGLDRGQNRPEKDQRAPFKKETRNNATQQ